MNKALTSTRNPHIIFKLSNYNPLDVKSCCLTPTDSLIGNFDTRGRKFKQ